MCKSILVLAMALILITAGGVTVSGKTSDHVLSLAFDKLNWKFSSQGRYLLVHDPRGLYQVFHPWDISSDGDFGAISTKTKIPSDWRGPVFLNLYAGDTYQADGWEQAKPGWTHTFAACHNLVGHRFKQVLIDGQVVWNQDVGDSEDFGYTSIDITKHVKPGKQFDLTLRVIDTVNPATKLPHDEYKLGIWDWQAQNDKDAEKKFYTRVFWGDVALSSGTPSEWEKNPARCATPFNPIKPEVSQRAVDEKGTFTLSAPDGLPEDGYPVTWGIPLAQGKIFDKEHVALIDSTGKPVPLQTQVLHKWPDGSIHWLLLDFQAASSDAGKAYTINYGTEVEPTPAQTGLTVKETDEAVDINTGALSFSIAKGAKVLAQAFTIEGETQPLGQKLTGMLKTRDGWVETEFEPVNETITVESNGPERATILLTGKLRSAEKVFGRFTCRIHAYRGKPYVRVLFRIFNDTDVPAQLVNEFQLRLQSPMDSGEVVLGEQKLVTGPAETNRLLVRQNKCDAYTVYNGSDAQLASGKLWTQPISLQTQEHGITGIVRRFAPLYPKRMWAGVGGQMVFDLFTSTIEYEQYVMTMGEARRHEILLYFHKGTCDQPGIRQVYTAFEKPPMLVSPEWYGKNQAFGSR